VVPAGWVCMTSHGDPFRRALSSRQLHHGKVSRYQAFTRQLTVAGEYRYVCSIHDESGMVGIIIVQ
jgi:plastocyanin